MLCETLRNRKFTSMTRPIKHVEFAFEYKWSEVPKEEREGGWMNGNSYRIKKLLRV